MQSKQQRNQLWSEDWRQTRLYNVGNALQHDHLLGNDAHNRWSVMGYQMDPLIYAGGRRFWRWSSLGLPYSPTHPGKNDPTQHLRTASWPQDQPKEDRSDAAESVQPKRATSPSCQSSKQRTSGESCKSFGLTLSPTNSYSPTAIKTAWRSSS